MLRQLVRLARPYPAASPTALALAIYSDADDRHAHAAESGFEGVACVDDAARATMLFADLWSLTGAPAARVWASGFLEFCLWMTGADGFVTNFVSDWDGTKNHDGLTSRRGGHFWQARAMRAFANTAVVLGDEHARAAVDHTLATVPRDGVPPDVRALHVLTALDLANHTGLANAELSRWCDEIASVKDGDVLLNSPDERGDTHLWGHLQEGVLADASLVLARPDLLRIATRSAEALIVPVVESAFALPVVQPYDVASAIYVLDRIYAVTGDVRYAGHANDARAWFDGRNSAHAPVYDRVNGRVADGIDGDRINWSSGAESNVVAAQALIEDVAAQHSAGIQQIPNPPGTA